jgi:hypothetical protein
MRAVLVLVSLAGLLEAIYNNRMRHLEDERHRMSCVVTIVRQHFPLRRTILLSSNDYDADLEDTLLRTMHGFEMSPFNVLHQSGVTALSADINTEKIRNYIMLTRSAEDLIYRVEELSKTESWDSRGRFLIVVTAEVAAPEHLALSIVQGMWDTAKVLNLVVLVQEDTMLNLYTWFPYSSHEHCDDVKNVVIINQWVMGKEGGFVKEVVLFPFKIPSNFHGCSLKISVAFRDSIETRFFSKHVRRLNVTLNYVSEMPHNVSLYDAIETCIIDAVFGKSDISFGGLPLLQEPAKHADVSLPYFVLKLNWFVPCRKPFSRLQRISHIFSVSVWVFMVIVLLLITVTFWWLAKRTNDSRSYTSVSSSLYNSWAVIVGVSVTEKPRSFRLKLMLLVFVWYCFAISTVFQTLFTSFLIDPGYQKQLTTLEEILESGIEFGYILEHNVHYNESTDWRHKEIRAKRKEFSSEQACVERIRDTGNFATLCQEWYVQNYTNYINDHSFVCPLNDYDTMYVFLSFYLPKGSFLLEFINRFVTFVTESGLIVKLTRDTFSPNKDVDKSWETFGDYFVFTVSHLRLAFYILFLGDCLSVLFFFGELLYSFRKNCSNRYKS